MEKLEIDSENKPEEKEYAWKVTQDMVELGKKIHRKTDKRCLKKFTSGEEYEDIPDLFHALMDCIGNNDNFKEVKSITEAMLDRQIKGKNIIMLNFNHRNKKRLKLKVWFRLKVYMECILKNCLIKHSCLMR